MKAIYQVKQRSLMALLAWLVISVASVSVKAQELYMAGKHYAIIDTPVTTSDKDKIEVVEVFWYGCSHCYNFEPLINAWKKVQPEDVNFVPYPGIWNATMQTHARMFFTAQALDVLDKVHTPIFQALVMERKRLSSPQEIENLFANYGVDREKFKAAYNSFGVTSKTKNAVKRSQQYKITGTPEMIVNGKYRVSASMSGGQAEMLKVVDFLVAKERRNLPAQ